MSLQHNTIQLLDYASEALNGIADGGIQPDDCHFASIKLSQAALRLSVEPLKRADIYACYQAMEQAFPTLQRLSHGEFSGFYRGWVDSTCHTVNASADLLNALASIYTHIHIDQTPAPQLLGRWYQLLPLAWWGGSR